MLIIKTTINSGVEIIYENTSVMLDALSSEPVYQFSALSDEMTKKIWLEHEEKNPNVLFFTHTHADHFSETLVRESAWRWPHTFFIAPAKVVDRQLLLAQDVEHYTSSNLDMHFIKTTHLPINLPDCPHYACYMTIGPRKILFAGDCSVCDTNLLHYLQGLSIDLAILPFIWWTFPRGRRAIEEILKPAHVLLVHLPDKNKDVSGIRAYLLTLLTAHKTDIDVRVAWDPFTTEHFD